MSLKENLDYIKEEVSAQESFMEKTFKLEQFYKKYKIVLIGTVSAVVIGFIGLSVSNYTNEQNMIKDNQAFNTFLLDSSNSEALNYLKTNNEKLHTIAMYMNDKNTDVSKIEFLSDLSKYTKAMSKNSIDDISTSTQSQNFLLKDFALFNKALIQAQNGKYQDSKESLKLISTVSSISSLSNMLEHYLLTK